MCTMVNSKGEECSGTGGKLNAMLLGRYTDRVGMGTEIPQVDTTTTMNPKKPLTEFPFFPDLRPELQIKIWKFAIPPRRLVRVKVQTKVEGQCGVDDIHFSSTETVCGLLGACHVSRETILKVYTTCLESPDGKKIRLDGSNDILILFCDPVTNLLLPALYKIPWFETPSNEPFIELHPSHADMFSKVKLLALYELSCYPQGFVRVDFRTQFPGQFRSLEHYVRMIGAGPRCANQILQAGEDVCLQGPCRRKSHPAYSNEQWAQIRDMEVVAENEAVEAIQLYEKTVNPGYKLLTFQSAEAMMEAERKNRIEQGHDEFPYTWL